MSQSPQQQSFMDVDTMLDVYILDYLAKRKLNASIKVFGDEAKVPLNVRAIDVPRGFLFEWWAVFWDIFISRCKSRQGSMEPCNEDFCAPQQQGGQRKSQNFNANDAITGRNTWVSEASTLMRQPVPKQWYGDDAGIVMNHISSRSHLPIKHQKQASDINSLTSSSINQSAQGPEVLSSGAHATGVLNNLPLKGWPLTGLDLIQTRLQLQQGALYPPPLTYQGQLEGQHQPPDERKRSQTENRLHPPMEKKRKQPLISSSTVVNSSGTANVLEAFSNSADVSMPNSPHNDKINIDEFLNYGAMDDNENSLLPHADKEPNMDRSDGFTFLEIGSVNATSINCCDVSLDGKLVAVGGQDKKATLWCTNSLEIKATFVGHLQDITDIRFSPSMLWLATSSHDKTIRIWDLENPGCLIKTFTGHTSSVLSLDFHTKKDVICSCDETEIRYWTIKNAGCFKVTKGGANLVRFQSGIGKYLASVVGKSVSLSDLENPQARRHILKGHESNVQSICWDSLGELLVSISEDSIKVWRMEVGGKANCIHELSVPGKRFHCGAFHPCYPSLLIIGCYQSMELWKYDREQNDDAS